MQAKKKIDGSIYTVLRGGLILLAAITLTPAFYSIAQSPSHVDYLPISAETARSIIESAEAPEPVSDAILVSISITPSDGTIIHYDHWEDGYEADPAAPVQATTEIWGDDDSSNGTVPGSASDTIDTGEVITLENSVYANPRDPSEILFDGGDLIVSTMSIEVRCVSLDEILGTQLEALGVGESPLIVNQFDISPGNQNASEYTSFAVISNEDNTLVEIDTGSDGTVDEMASLLRRDVYIVDGGIADGAMVTVSRPVEACMLRSGRTL